MDALIIGRPPAAKAGDQLRAEARDRRARWSVRAEQALETARLFVLGLGFLLVLVAG